MTRCHVVSHEIKGYLSLPEVRKEDGYSIHVLGFRKSVCPSGGGHHIIGCSCVGVMYFDGFVVVNIYYDGCGDTVQQVMSE